MERIIKFQNIYFRNEIIVFFSVYVHILNIHFS